MTDTFRALCAELADELHKHTSLYDGHESELVARARTALAQPEPVGMTDLPPVQETAPERIWLHLNGANEWLPFKDEEGVVWSPDQIDESDIPYVRADLTRYGRPTITPIPVSERPWEREGFSDAEGRCWWFWPVGEAWSLCSPPPHRATHCLPHYALPLPTQPTP